MINVKITPNGFTCTGHADSAPYGSDIVCAAVSALVQATVLALETDLIFIKSKKINSGNVEIKYFPKVWRCIDEQMKLEYIILPMRLGLAEIAKQYPDKIKVEINT